MDDFPVGTTVQGVRAREGWGRGIVVEVLGASQTRKVFWYGKGSNEPIAYVGNESVLDLEDVTLVEEEGQIVTALSVIRKLLSDDAPDFKYTYTFPDIDHDDHWWGDILRISVQGEIFLTFEESELVNSIIKELKEK